MTDENASSLSKDNLLLQTQQDSSEQESSSTPQPPTAYNPVLGDKMEFWPAMKKIFGSSVMPILSYFLGFVHGTASLILLGYTESPEVMQASFGLGQSTLMIFLTSFSIGFSNTLMMYVPQAFGSGQYEYCGIYTNRQIFLNTIILSTFSIPLLWSYKLFILIGQTEAIARNAALYTRTNIIAQIFFSIYQCHQRFCFGQRDYKISFIMILLGLVVFFVLMGVFFFWFQWEMLAVSLSIMLMWVSRAIIQYMTIAKTEKFKHSLFSFFHNETISNLSPQLWMGLQTLSLNLWSLWAIETFLFISSYMGELEMATQTIVRNISNLFYMIPLGFSLSCNVLVGNNIGAGDIPRAKYYTVMCIFAGLIWSLLSIAVLYILKPFILLLFTSSDEVRDLLSDIYYLMNIFVFFDCASVVCAGIIRSMGRQGLASIITCIGYWVIGIPSTIFMVFKLDWGMTGLLLGICFALIFNFISYLIFIWHVNWEEVVEDMRKRKDIEKSKNS